MTDDRATYSSAFLSLSEKRARTAEIELEGDLLITVANAEPRCLEVLQCSLGRFKAGAIIRFESTNELVRREENYLAHAERLNDVCEGTVKPERLPITELQNWFGQFRSILLNEYKERGRPLSVAIDASCLPKHYLLYIIGLSLNKSIVSSLRIFYSEADYHFSHVGKSSDENTTKNYEFSLGEWQPIIVPYFEGHLALESRSRIIALLGLENLQARKFIRSYQADHYAAIVASASHSAEYSSIAEREGAVLAYDLDIPEKCIFNVRATSAVAVVKLLSDELKSHCMTQDTIVCLGTKPHAIGAAVHAILNESTSIVCRVPSAYPPNLTKATGNSWLINIEDLSSLKPHL